MTASATEALEAPLAARAEERWSPSVQGWVARLLVLGLIFGSVLWATANVPSYWADRISLAAIYAIIGLSLNIVLGYVGQVSLGHHGFVGIAAFVAAYYATMKAGCTLDSCAFGTFLTATLYAAISGGLAAMLLGLIALRIKGLYLALITLAYGFAAERSIFEIPFLTNAGAGMPATRPNGWETDREFAFLTFIFLALVIFVDWRLLRSKVGRAILSIKHSEAVASTYGINVTAYKVFAFILSGIFAGIAGSLFAFHETNVVSNNFNFATALLWVLMVVVGGLGNRIGVVIGSAFFALFPFLILLIGPLDHFIRDTLGREPDYFTIVIGSTLALLTIILHPGGIGEQVSPITRWLGGKPFSLHPDGHEKHKEPKAKGPGLLAKFGLHREENGSERAEGERTDGELAALGRAVASPTPSRDHDTERVDVSGNGVQPPDVWGALVGRRDDAR
ncbi:MAG TPA: branched-chain amino acid ABC transporter permease [Actinomycetota bacterium]|nr:branched-chain amino acid ABC transporter permease [Actinomycetota bacterium]